MRFRHSQSDVQEVVVPRFGAIQDLYPNPPVLRYHRVAPKLEREFGATETPRPINWLDIAVAFFLGYLLGGRRYA
jgi:hypothetical protein